MSPRSQEEIPRLDDDLVVMTEAKRKRRRAGNPKTRSGCRTCASRRVKCDEAKPRCQRCVKNGWECEGYPQFPHQNTSTTKPLQSKSKYVILAAKVSTRGTPEFGHILIEPASHPRSDKEDECQYFNLFQTRTAAELTGFFEFNIWDRVVLQASQGELYAWHAVVAIGALHRTLEASNEPNELALHPKSHHAFAFKQYALALQQMRQLAQRSMTDCNIRDTLISCLLTTCFESFVGNQESALVQAQAGIDVMRSWRTSRPEQEKYILDPGITANSDTVGDELVAAFTRLDFQVMMMKNTIKERPVCDDYPILPYKFDSVTHAKFCWDSIVQRLQQWHISQQYAASEQFSSLDFGEINMREHSKRPEFAASLEAELEEYENITSLWYKSFEPLFNESRRYPGSKKFGAANVIMVRYIPSKFAISRKAMYSDMYSDQYLDDYKAVVSLSTEVLELYSSAPQGKAVFVMDSNFVLALFLVATRCREPMVRREAIALLVKHPRREGLWDSFMAASVAAWMMQKEEEGMVDGYVPETARLRIVKNDFVLAERKAFVRCSKVIAGKRVMLPDVTLTW